MAVQKVGLPLHSNLPAYLISHPHLSEAAEVQCPLCQLNARQAQENKMSSPELTGGLMVILK